MPERTYLTESSTLVALRSLGMAAKPVIDMDLLMATAADLPLVKLPLLCPGLSAFWQVHRSFASQLLVGDLRLDELGQKNERFLPAEVACLGWNDSRHPFLHDVQLSSAGNLL